MNEDRRQHPRLVIPLAVEFQLEGESHSHHGTLVDISAGGVAMMTEDPLPAGGELANLRFKLESLKGSRSVVIETETQIVRCDERTGIGRKSEYLVGLRFRNLPLDDFEMLRAIVEERLGYEQAQDEPVPDPRLECEQPIAIRYQRFDEFVSEVATNLSLSGMFIRAKKPPPPGSVLDFSFQLGDDFELIQGRAQVVWTRPLAEGPDRPAGMGIRFLELDEVSQRVLQKIVDRGLGDQKEANEGAGDSPELESKVAALESELAGAQSEIGGLAARLRSSQEDLTLAVGRVAELDRKLATANQRAATLDTQLATVDSGSADFESQMADASSALETERDRVAELEGRIKVAEQEREDLNQTHQNAANDLERLRSERDTARDEKRQIEEQTAEASQELEQARDDLQAAEARLTTDERRIAELEELQATASQHDEQLQAADGRIALLEGSLAHTERERDEAREGAEGRIGELEGALAHTEHERDELRQATEGRIAELEGALVHAEQERDERTQAAEGRIAELEGTLGHAEHEHGEQRQAAEGRIAELEGTLGHAEHEHGEQRQAAEGRIAELEEFLARAEREQHEQRQDAESRITELEGTLAHTEHERDQQRHGSEGRIAELEESLAHVEREREEQRKTAEGRIAELEGASAEGEGLRHEIEELRQAAGEVQTRHDRFGEALQARDDELARAKEALAESSRKSQDLVGAMNELRNEADDRVKHLEGELTTTREEAQQLRTQLESDMTGKQHLRDELERAEHERKQSAGKYERLNFDMEELLRETEKRTRAHEERFQEGQVRIEELESKQHASDDVEGRVERLQTEVDNVRAEAASHEETLRQEIAKWEDRSSESQTKIQRLLEAESEHHREVERLNARAEELEQQLAQTHSSTDEELSEGQHGDVEEELRQEIESMRQSLDEAAEQQEQMASELSKGQEEANTLAEANEALTATRSSLLANQQQLERELEFAASSPTDAALAAGSTQKPAAVRTGGLRAAAMVGFGLLLGFFASYPFESLLVSAEPITIRATTAGPSRPAPPPKDEQPAAVAEADSATAAAASTEPATAGELPVRPSPERAAERWAAAWSSQRVDAYLAAYSDAFTLPDDLDRTTWEAQRRLRILKPESIRVELGAVELVSFASDTAILRFNQSYATESYSDRVSKTLELIWEKNGWKIAHESSEPLS